jgi:hypothetical protein
MDDSVCAKLGRSASRSTASMVYFTAMCAESCHICFYVGYALLCGLLMLQKRKMYKHIPLFGLCLDLELYVDFYCGFIYLFH